MLRRARTAATAAAGGGPGLGIVRIARRDDPQPAVAGDRGEHVVVRAVQGGAVIGQLDDDVLGAEAVDEEVELRRRPPGLRGARGPVLEAGRGERAAHAPLRQPVSTAQCPSARSARSSRACMGRPFCAPPAGSPR